MIGLNFEVTADGERMLWYDPIENVREFIRR